MDIGHLAALPRVGPAALAQAVALGDIPFREGVVSGLHCILATPGEVNFDVSLLRFAPESMRLGSDDDLEPIRAGATASNRGLDNPRLPAGSCTPPVSHIAGAELVLDNALAAIEERFSNSRSGSAPQRSDVRTGEFPIAVAHNGIALPRGSVGVAGSQFRHIDALIDMGDRQRSPRGWRLVADAETGRGRRGGTLHRTLLAGVGIHLPRNTESPAGCPASSAGN